MGYACLRTNADDKLASLLIVHNALPQKSQYDLRVLDEAKKVAELIEESGTKIQDLHDLAIALTQAERLSEAQEIISRINDVTVKAETLGKLAVAFAKKKDNEQAIAIFNQIKILIGGINDQSLKVEALRKLAVAYLQTELVSQAKPIFKEAIAIALTIKDIKILSQLAVALAQAGDIENANILFIEAKKLTEGIENNFKKAETLRELALDFALSKFVEEAKATFNKAEEVARNIAQDFKQVYPLLELAKVLALAGEVNKAIAIFDEAIKVPNAIEEGWEQAEILRKFAETLVKAEFVTEACVVFTDARKAARSIRGNWEQAEALRNLAAGLVQTGLTEEVRQFFTEAEKLALKKGSDAQQEQVLCKWAVVLEQAGFTDKASAICNNADKFAQAKQDMARMKERAEGVREFANAFNQIGSHTEEEWELLEAINQAENSTEVWKIVQTVVNFKLFEQPPPDQLVLLLAMAQQFPAAIKIAQAIKDDQEQISILSELAATIAWMGCFKEALSIFGFKNGQSQFLNALVEWIFASEKVEQKRWLEILQETIRIFGWMYPYWHKVYDQLVSESSRGTSPISENPIQANKRKRNPASEQIQTSKNSRLKLVLRRNVSSIIISPEQAQRLEICIHEATAILYHNIPKNKLSTIESIERIILEQILQSVITKIAVFHQGFE
ncbi:MAG: hypothetical protein KME46_17835 [Brasilonema angustatum HA4187-MV1]|nr:hypothetical protein [Brasilonema angustatum HA4187-MV1]